MGLPFVFLAEPGQPLNKTITKIAVTLYHSFLRDAKERVKRMRNFLTEKYVYYTDERVYALACPKTKTIYYNLKFNNNLVKIYILNFK